MKRSLIFLAIIALLCVPQFAVGDDLADLKAADQKSWELYKSTNPNDTEAYINVFFDEFIWIDSEAAFPYIMTKEQLKESKNNYISRYEYRDWIEGNSIYRVVGNYGIVCSYGTDIVKPKGSPEIIRNTRTTLTYVKINGKWLLHSGHVSLIPSGN